TAASELIEGLQTHNAGEVSAAAQQLATNASDLASNNVKADGGTYGAGAVAGTATAAAPTATDLFNDATTRMVGGIGPDQVAKVIVDLSAVQQMLIASDHQIKNLSDLQQNICIIQQYLEN